MQKNSIQNNFSGKHANQEINIKAAIIEVDSLQNINAGKNMMISDIFTAKKLAFETRSSLALQSSGYFG